MFLDIFEIASSQIASPHNNIAGQALAVLPVCLDTRRQAYNDNTSPLALYSSGQGFEFNNGGISPSGLSST